MLSFHVIRTGWKSSCLRELLSVARASAIISSMEQKLSSLSYATGGGFGAAGGEEESVVVSIAGVLELLEVSFLPGDYLAAMVFLVWVDVVAPCCRGLSGG